MRFFKMFICTLLHINFTKKDIWWYLGKIRKLYLDLNTYLVDNNIITLLMFSANLMTLPTIAKFPVLTGEVPRPKSIVLTFVFLISFDEIGQTFTI